MVERELEVRIWWEAGKHWWEVKNEHGVIVMEGGAVYKATAQRQLQEAIERMCIDWADQPA